MTSLAAEESARTEEILRRVMRLLHTQPAEPADDERITRCIRPGHDISIFKFDDGDIHVKLGPYSVVVNRANTTWTHHGLADELLKRLNELMVLDDLASS